MLNCRSTKVQKQNTELPFNASDSRQPLRPLFIFTSKSIENIYKTWYYIDIHLHIKKDSKMEISGTSGQIQDYINKELSVEQAEALYQVKLIKMMQESDAVAGTLLEDTAEISKEAMDKYLAEIKAQ